MNLKNTLFISFLAHILLASSAYSRSWSPPQQPEIPPIIIKTYTHDLDGDRIDDELNVDIEASRMSLLSERKGLSSNNKVYFGDIAEVELIFKEPITQEQIDAFQSLGGEITYIYRTVSYGWQGRIPYELVNTLSLILGDTLVLIKGPKPMELCMDLAAQTGRVSPIWESGFAGNKLGFKGDPNITIGIIDSGVDGSHPELAGRMAYWIDCSDDNETDAVDYNGHGSHVAGIAVAQGIPPAPRPGNFLLRYTDTGNLNGVSSDLFYPSPIYVPLDVYVETRCIWTGGSTATIKLFQNLRGENHWMALDQYSRSGTSGLTVSFNLTPEWGYIYSFGLCNTGGNVENYSISTSMSAFSSGHDIPNIFRGVAPQCRWAAAKISRNNGGQNNSLVCTDLWLSQAIDDFIENRRKYDIKIINISLVSAERDTICNTVLVGQINTAVNNGIVITLSAGNNGKEYDPTIYGFQYAAKAITVGASNDENALTCYSSIGYSGLGNRNPGEVRKPDLIAPGGSDYHSYIMSVDSGTNDGYGIDDQQSNDYANLEGTSQSSPFVAGCAALVIDAMLQQGNTWDFTSDKQPLYVKLLLCATATETGMPREDGQYTDELIPQRDASLPGGFSAGKDPYEGYGIINPDAAVEAAALSYTWGTTEPNTLGSGLTERRAWARTVHFSPRTICNIRLHNPSDGDFDLYLYDAVPDSNGEPHILECSTSVGKGVDEQISYGPTRVFRDALLVVKRVEGSGTFELTPE